MMFKVIRRKSFLCCLVMLLCLAVFPFAAFASTFGNTGFNEYLKYSVSNERMRGSILSVESAANLSKVSAYVDSGGAAVDMKVLAYNVSENYPTSLFLTSPAVSVSAAGWYDFNLSGIYAAGSYCFQVVAESDAGRLYASATSGGVSVDLIQANLYSNPPAVYPEGQSLGEVNFSIYATYSIPSAEPTPTPTATATPLNEDEMWGVVMVGCLMSAVVVGGVAVSKGKREG